MPRFKSVLRSCARRSPCGDRNTVAGIASPQGDASWCNPIEMLWRWLKQRKLHLHRLSEEGPASSINRAEWACGRASIPVGHL